MHRKFPTRRHRLFLSALVVAACTDSVKLAEPPGPGRLRVTVVASAALSTNFYPVTVAGHVLGLPGSGEPLVASDLEPGEYRVEVGTPHGCTVGGDNPRTASVVPGKLVDVSFDVYCGGMVRFVVATFGENQDELYDAGIDDGPPRRIGATDSVEFRDVVAGNHSVWLGGIKPNCGPIGGAAVSANLAPGQHIRRAIGVSCVERAGNLRVRISTTGTPSGIPFFGLIGSFSQVLPPDGTLTLWKIAPGEYSLNVTGYSGCSLTFTGSLYEKPDSYRYHVRIENMQTTEIAIVASC